MYSKLSAKDRLCVIGSVKGHLRYLEQRVLAAGNDEAELEDPEVFEAAMVEQNKSKERHEEGQEYCHQILHNILVPIGPHSLPIKHSNCFALT